MQSMVLCLGQNLTEMEIKECNFLLCVLVLHFHPLLREKGIVLAIRTMGISFTVPEAVREGHAENPSRKQKMDLNVNKQSLLELTFRYKT